MNMPLGFQTPGPLRSASILRTFHAVLVAGATILGFYICYRLTLPFLTPIVAAFVLAVLFGPLHGKISARLKHPSVAAFVSVLAIASVVLAALVLLVAQLVQEAAAGAVLVRRAFEGGLVYQLLTDHPKIAPLFQFVLDQINAAGLATEAASWLTNVSASMLRGSVVQIAGVLLTFYLLFYFLRDRTAIVGALRSLFPFTETETAALFASAVDTVHATVFGMVITGALLGLFGGLIFAAVGVPAAFLWGSVMAVFAILPILGIGMIWIPASVWLALNGAWAQAVILTIAFALLSVADSVLYPYLVGNRMRLHTAIAFIAAIGGLVVFGPVGFVVGPLAVSLMISLKDVLYARAKAFGPQPESAAP